MTGTVTASTSFTITDARYVSSKIGADLHVLRALYNKPSLPSIENYVEETAQLLKHGYLSTVDFGFKSGDTWKLRLRYRATASGQLLDLRPGSLNVTIDTTGLSFYSYLCYSEKWYSITAAERETFKKTLLVSRTGADEPSLATGTTTSGHGYGRNGYGVSRDVHVAW